MTKRVTLYARVSSEAQDGENSVSIQQQIEDMQKLCERQNWTVVETFIDNRDYKATHQPKRGKIVNPSGERSDRPQFQAVLQLVESGSIDAIICWRDDRLTRHPRVNVALEDSLDIADKQHKEKIQIHDATGAILDRFTMRIKAVVWQEENKRRVERVNLGKAGTLKAGFWPGPYHRLGYATEQGDRGKRIVLGPESEVQTIKDIFNWYDSGIPTVEIRKRLIADGREQRGQNGRWQYDWNQHVILHILRSEDYTGTAVWQFSDGSTVSIDIPQIISQEQFKRVKRRMAENLRQSSRNTKNIFMLQHLLECGCCHNAIRATNKSRYKYGYDKDGNQTWRVEHGQAVGHKYSCNVAIRFPELNHTNPVTWQGVELDDEIWRVVAKEIIDHPELIQEQVINRQNELQAQGENLDSDIAKARTRLASFEQERISYTRQLAREKITEAIYDQLIAETEGLAKIEQEQLDYLLDLRDSQTKINDSLEYAYKLLKSMQARLPELSHSIEELRALPKSERDEIVLERKEILNALVDKIILHADGRKVIVGLIESKDFTVDVPGIDYHKLFFTFAFGLSNQVVAVN